MQKTVVINVVGLTTKLLPYMPFLNKWTIDKNIANIKPCIPAVTCSAQATYLTGKTPTEHGIVANGWWYADTKEVRFWQQSNALVQSTMFWDEIKKNNPAFTVCNMFWWFNMYANVDFSCTPRPQYRADGQKIPDIHTHPNELRDELQSKLGQFPLFHFWGPKTSIKSSQWIADASVLTDKTKNPTLTLIYLPHLDYNLQKFGNDFSKIKKDLTEIDQVLAQLIGYYESVNANIIILSEYGITDVENPVHINRILRKNNYLNIRIENKLEQLDAGASDAFAVADHQIAHIYIKNKNEIEKIKILLQNSKGIENVYYKNDTSISINHARSGDLIAIANDSSWFTYYFWLNDAQAPDYARMVDIHKKPGYDPVELLINKEIKFPILIIISKLIKKKLGFRSLMNIISLDASLIKGSHGIIPKKSDDYPVFITKNKENKVMIEATQIAELLKKEILVH